MYLLKRLANLVGRALISKIKHVQSVNDTRDPTQNGQTDVDEEVSTASSFKEDTQGREDDRKEDLADVTVSRIG
jgi:hypothetical protein